MRIANKSGFTLIELLVYMAILGFVIVVAGRVFSDSTTMRVRTQNMVKAMEAVNSTSKLLKEDLERMGAKEWKEVNNADNFKVEDDVYMKLQAPNADTSSYILDTRQPAANLENPEGKFDQITFRTMDYKTDGEVEAVREIRYLVTNVNSNNEGRLERQCKTLKGTVSNICPNEFPTPGTVMATNVVTFSLNPSIPGVRPVNGSIPTSAEINADTLMFPAAGATTFSFKPQSGGNVLSPPIIDGNNTSRITLSMFSSSANGNEDKFSQVLLANSNASGCEEFTFKPGETYFIEFDLPYPKESASTDPDKYCRICMFQPGEDHIAVGLRTENNPNVSLGIPDFAVYPPQIPNGTKVPTIRHQEFSIPNDGNNSELKACVAVTFAFYSQNVRTGELVFTNFRVGRKIDEIYHFAQGAEAYTYNPGDANGGDIRDKKRVKAFELELATRFRSEVARSKTVIPVPNNGVLAKGTN